MERQQSGHASDSEVAADDRNGEISVVEAGGGARLGVPPAAAKTMKTWPGQWLMRTSLRTG